MPQQTNPIAETNHFIVLDKYEREWESVGSYQSEADLENELIRDLTQQGYDYRKDIKTPEAMLANVRVHLQALNAVEFSDDEWKRFVDSWLDKPNEGNTEKAQKIHENHVHDFVFDDGHIQNIYLLDKKQVTRNKVEVIKQFEQTGTYLNRYDVTILVNGLPLVQIELKKRGVAIREAFNQIHRYSKESFNSDHSLFKYLQLFIISNGTNTRYFANTTKRNKNSFDFSIHWAKSDNNVIMDLKDFTATFLQKRTLLKVLLQYSVFDINNTLLVMRPYQIAATERILWKIQSSFEANTLSKPESGGYIWHTTGSGKTLTSFKAARLATELDFIDKVFFVVDRKDLDYQTMKEYQRFSKDSVNGSNNTAALKRNLSKDDNKIVVTTIQKLNNLMKSESDLEIYGKQVIFIFDECHRSQFGEAQRNLKRKFKRFCQFGFTGTPIFPDNSSGIETTKTVFGAELHSYVITDAIRDEKVLKFKVDYNDVSPQFKKYETEEDEKKLTAAENKKAFLHPDRITGISQYILDNFRRKTHRMYGASSGFNAMFAVNSVDAAKLYYEKLNELQAGADKPLKIATIYSFAANGEQNPIGDIQDESFDVSAMNTSDKEFLTSTINDYNKMFRASFSIDSKGFQDYYRDLAKRVKGVDSNGAKLAPAEKIDLLIVVGMFLTGFDAPTLNTLFVDKNLRYHGLIQAYSRTNRIYDATKAFGNIVTFRDLEQATIDAITLFGDDNTKNVILEKSFKKYMQGFIDHITGEARRGFLDISSELKDRFPEPAEIDNEADKKDFVKLFGEYLQVENILRNYDEFTTLKAAQVLDLEEEGATEDFMASHNVSEKELAALKEIEILEERKIQDYRSTYNDIRDWRHREQSASEDGQTSLDWDDVVFEVDLLKSQEINLDYILELILDKNKTSDNKDQVIEDIRRTIRASIGNRAKEDLIIEFINQTDLDEISDSANIIEAFYTYAKAELRQEAIDLINSERLNTKEAKRYLASSINRGFASENGTELNSILPKMSPLNPEYLTKKQTVFQKISDFVDKYKGIDRNIQDNLV